MMIDCKWDYDSPYILESEHGEMRVSHGIHGKARIMHTVLKIDLGISGWAVN